MEKTQLRLGCVVMAAGNASRFGENKLAREFGGKPLIRRALEAVPADAFTQVVVVTQYPEAAALAAEFGFLPVENAHPEWGVSYTIQLGLAALSGCDGILFQVADQPLLRRETVAKAAALFRCNPDRIVALSHGGVRGNPCLFPARFFPELMALTGDRGGSGVIRRHPEALLMLETAEEELWDVDTPQALTALEQGQKAPETEH